MSASSREERGSPKFKDRFDEALARSLADRLAATWPSFDVDRFVAGATRDLEKLEFKDRVAQFAVALHRELPDGFGAAAGVLRALLGDENENESGIFSEGYPLMPIAEYVARYGLDHFEESMSLLYEITKRHTSEYAVRPYIERYPERTMALFADWVTDPNPHVRRLVSEGTRPRLPWATWLRKHIDSPRPAMALLERLRNDPSRYVQRSVANHMNDISKDHPDLALETLSRWNAEGGESTRWIVRHAARSLLKDGNARALELLGFAPDVSVEVEASSITPARVELGSGARIEFVLRNTGPDAASVRMYYRLAPRSDAAVAVAGTFVLGEACIAAGGVARIGRSHRFRSGTTRRYVPGRYGVCATLNGRHMEELALCLTWR